MWQGFAALAWLLVGIGTMHGGERFSKLDVHSRFLGSREVQVYLPPSYDAAPDRRYPVLYLHDWQNVFSTAGTNIAFGWGSWELDKTVDALYRDGKMQEIIMVAVNNSPARFSEYGGRVHTPGATNNISFENYVAFLIQELKPQVDSKYRTRADAANTAVMGSSMGGLCSVALAWEH